MKERMIFPKGSMGYTKGPNANREGKIDGGAATKGAKDLRGGSTGGGQKAKNPFK